MNRLITRAMKDARNNDDEAMEAPENTKIILLGLVHEIFMSFQTHTHTHTHTERIIRKHDKCLLDPKSYMCVSSDFCPIIVFRC